MNAPEFSSKLQVSSFNIMEGVLFLEGSATGNLNNGATPEVIKLVISLVSIKFMQHSGAWVHIVLEKGWFLDMLFKDADEADEFFKEYHNGLLDFYAADGEGTYDDEPGMNAGGLN